LNCGDGGDGGGTMLRSGGGGAVKEDWGRFIMADSAEGGLAETILSSSAESD
jgi:hypothetical protein